MLSFMTDHKEPICHFPPKTYLPRFYLRALLKEDERSTECSSCAKHSEDKGDLLVCCGCGIAAYCNAACQRAHWTKHKNECCAKILWSTKKKKEKGKDRVEGDLLAAGPEISLKIQEEPSSGSGYSAPLADEAIEEKLDSKATGKSGVKVMKKIKVSKNTATTLQKAATAANNLANALDSLIRPV